MMRSQTTMTDASATRTSSMLTLFLAIVVLSALLAIGASPDTAQAADAERGVAGAAFGSTVQASGSGTSESSVISTQASGLASSDASVIDKKAKKNAKAIVKKAKASKGSDKDKLKKIFTYIATDKKWKGKFSFDSYLNFWMKARNTDNARYYASAAGPKTMKGIYEKYAVDAYKAKKASCYHYAALFAVAAKQALGDKAKVRLAVGTGKMAATGAWNPHHSWVEVKLGKTTYVYDTQQGNSYSKDVAKSKHDFGKYCGSKKSKVKSTYKKYKGAKYCTVKL